MTRPTADICVAGLVYFEVYVPALAPIPSGTESFVHEIPVAIGGAVNTASVANALGAEVVLAYPRGDGLSDLAIDAALGSMKLETRPWVGPDNPAVSLVYTSATDRSFVSAAAFSSLAACPALPAARWLHAPGIREAQALTSRLEEGRANGARISVSASWVPDLLEALRTPKHAPWDLLVINEAEARCVAPDLDEALTVLSHAAHRVVITRGPRGSLAQFERTRVVSPAAEPEGTHTTGAGDAFTAGLLVALCENAGPREALEFAHRVAARKMRSRGGCADNAAQFADLRGRA